MWGSVDEAVKHLDLLADDGMEVVRFDVSWRNMEPQPRRYRYLNKLDKIMRAATVRNISPIITVVETPAWANGGNGAWFVADEPGDYASFVGLLARRYAGRVLGWEIWNEPNLVLFWNPRPDAAAYTQLVLRTSAVIREADPAALVVAGSIAFGDVRFVEEMYDAGVKGAYDVLAVHPYTLTRPPDDETDRYHSLTSVLHDLKATLEARGDGDVSLWLTEFGWAIEGRNSITEMDRAAFMKRSVEILRERPYVGVVVMYTIDVRDSRRYGLSTNGVRSPSWRAYVEAIREPEG